MIRLTDQQVRAAATDKRLVNIVSAPGSGKTTVAAERFGYRRYRRPDDRGVLGLSFTRAAASELGDRVRARWGSDSTQFPHRITTFDDFHVSLFQHLLDQSLVHWPKLTGEIQVFDDYRGFPGYRSIAAGSWIRYMALTAANSVFSKAKRSDKRRLGISTAAEHKAILSAGMCSHEDLRRLLAEALRSDEVWATLKDWIASNYSDLIVDEIYDAAELDLLIARMAAEAGLGVTVIGDPWQAVYGWRGATPDKVPILLDTAFVDYPLSASFRFRGEQMPALAELLRNGKSVDLPSIRSVDIDVAIARRWERLLPSGENVLPLAFRTVSNRTDAMLNLLLDTITRAHLGKSSFGREGAIVQLGIAAETLDEMQDQLFQPALEDLVDGAAPTEVMEELREAIRALGCPRPKRLSAEKEAKRVSELAMLASRLRLGNLIPGMTVHQAKGQEWQRVGVALSPQDVALLDLGLKPLTDDHCILYVALTRARDRCGRLDPIAAVSPVVE
ncbi:MAG: UvrD-helicase domain-containing protein [Mycobacterium sp.]